MPRYQNKIQDERLTNMEISLKVVNSEMGDIKVNLAKVKTDVIWIKKFFFIIATASIGSLIIGLFNAIMK